MNARHVEHDGVSGAGEQVSFDLRATVGTNVDDGGDEMVPHPFLTGHERHPQRRPGAGVKLCANTGADEGGDVRGCLQVGDRQDFRRRE